VLPARADGESVAERPIPELVASCEIAVGGVVPAGFLEAATSLRYWIVPFAGIPTATRAALSRQPDLIVLNSHFNAAFVAEHAWALLLASAKQIVPVSELLRAGDWRPRYADPTARFLGGSTLLLLGYGAIGRALLPLARGLGMRVLAIKRTPGTAPELDALGTREDLHAWLPRVDAIIVSLPATPPTNGYLGPAEFACMKRGTLLVNVGRGSAIDEEAFHDALASGLLGGAGIDTWWNYPADEAARAHTPPSRFDLSSYDHLVFSPHRASHVLGRPNDRFAALGEILRSIADGKPIHPVDLQAGY
jgi:phosphoglycerate dehydrogenase-like enzyme